MEKDDLVRKFKRVNVLGLDFYVDWLDFNGFCDRIISIKDVHGGRSFVYRDLMCGDRSVEDMFLEACGVKRFEKNKEVKVEEAEKEVEVAPAALETEQPKEETDGKKTKGSNKRVKK